MKKLYIIGILIIAVSVAFIVNLITNVSTYATFETAKNHPGKEYHVIGKVNFNKPLEYDPHANANIFGFYMNDTLGVEKKVLLNKAKPQDFEKSEQVVLIGKMKDDQFIASEILMKCPSKYNNTKELVKQ